MSQQQVAQGGNTMSSEYSQRRWIEFKTLVAALTTHAGDRDKALTAMTKAHPKRTFIPKDINKAVHLAAGQLTPKAAKPAKVTDKTAVKPTVKRVARTTAAAKPAVMSVVPNFRRLSITSAQPKA